MAHSNLVQSLERGLSIIDLVARSGSGLTLAEIADALGVKRPTAFNLTRTLVASRYLEKTSRPVRYLLGVAVLENAEAWRHRETARQFEGLVKRLASELPTSTVALAEPLGGEVVAVHLIDKNRPGVVQHSSTRRLAPYVHASTLCMLAFWTPDEEHAYLNRYPFQEFGTGVWGTEKKLRAFLDQSRKRGYVAWEGPNSRFLAASPIFSPQQSLLASVGISIPMDDTWTSDEKQAVVNRMLSAVADLH